MPFQKLKNMINNLKDDDQQTTDQKIEDHPLKKNPVDTDLDNMISAIKSIYTVPENSDVKFRNLLIAGIDKRAFIVYISSISDVQLIDEHIIKSLLTNHHNSQEVENIISAPSFTTVQQIDEAVTGINNGDIALFVEGQAKAYIINSGNFQGRGIERAENEVVVKGPKEAFNEKISDNLSLLRKK